MVDKIPTDSASGVNDLETYSTVHSNRRIPQDTIEEALYDESGDCYPNHQNGEPEELGVPRSKHVTFAPRLQRSPQLAAGVKDHRHGHGDHSEPSDLHHVYVPPLEPDPEEYFTYQQQEELLYSEGNGDTDVKGHVIMGDGFKGHVPEVNPGVVAEEQRRQVRVSSGAVNPLAPANLVSTNIILDGSL